MPIIISRKDQAEEAIQTFNNELQGSPDLQSRLSYNRAWYILPRDGGTPLFGPSKFIGYRDVNAESYLENAGDGRETERVLSQWYETIETDHPMYAELYDALTMFLGQYGKSPSSATRINLPKDLAETSSAELSAEEDIILADLLIAAAARLPLNLRRRVAAAIV